jgi:hypothetical protein
MGSSATNIRTPYNGYDAERLFMSIDGGSWSRISISSQWRETLMPLITDRDTTTLGAILEEQLPVLRDISSLEDYFDPTKIDYVGFVEHAVATIVADSIARVGSNLQPNSSAMIRVLGTFEHETFSSGSPKVVIPLTSDCIYTI